MTDEQLQEIVLSEKKNKWMGSNEDILHVRKDILDVAMEELFYLCYDAVNLIYEFSSSTGGMYGSWNVSISPSCTVYVDRVKECNGGHGTTINAALADFALRIRAYKRKIDATRIVAGIQEKHL